MTDEQLNEIEARAKATAHGIMTDVLVLVIEVRRLTRELQAETARMAALCASIASAAGGNDLVSTEIKRGMARFQCEMGSLPDRETGLAIGRFILRVFGMRPHDDR